MGKLTQSEKKLIEEYLEGNEITQCPTGTSGIYVDYVWRTDTPDRGRLVPVSGPTGSDALRAKRQAMIRETKRRRRVMKANLREGDTE